MAIATVIVFPFGFDWSHTSEDDGNTVGVLEKAIERPMTFRDWAAAWFSR